MSSSSSKPVSLVLSIFASDALALGTHWVYNSDWIRSSTKLVTSLSTNTFNSYHKTKKAGDFTHYGDSARIVLESLAENHSWNRESYVQHWLKRWETLQTTSYYDSATRNTFNNLKAGKTGLEASSDETDLGHVAKTFPLILVSKSEDEYVKSAVELSQASLKPIKATKAAEWLARVFWRVYHQKQKPSIVIQQVADEIKDEWLSSKVKQGLESVKEDHETALKSFGGSKEIDDPEKGKWTVYFGKACPLEGALPATVHFVAKYEDASDPTEALFENTTVGGDNAARNLAIAAILYAYRGTDFKTIQGLVDGLTQKKELEELIQKV